MTLKTIKEEQERDHALYFVEDGEDGFSPEHNKFVIENTIRKTIAMKKKKDEAYKESIRERADAVATYLTSRAVQSSKPVEKYFGKRTLAYLRGEKIVEVLKNSSLFGQKRTLYIPGN